MSQQYTPSPLLSPPLPSSPLLSPPLPSSLPPEISDWCLEQSFWFLSHSVVKGLKSMCKRLQMDVQKKF